jgi:hypothetical protein
VSRLNRRAPLPPRVNNLEKIYAFPHLISVKDVSCRPASEPYWHGHTGVEDREVFKDRIFDLITARHFVRKMRGGAQAHLIEANDGNCYVVKFINNPQHRRVLINEWVAGHLMRHLGIRTPLSALIEVSRDFLDQNANVCFHHRDGRTRAETGVHFGSRYPGHPSATTIYDALPDLYLSRIVNGKDFIGALVFDRWVNNTDRPQAIFAPVADVNNVMAAGGFHFEALMIDRGEAFGGADWVLRDSPLCGIHARRAVYDGLRGRGDCEPWLSRIEAIQEGTLWDIFETIPHAWRHGEDKNFERVVRDLLRARCRIGDSISRSANSSDRPFRNWTHRTTKASSMMA